MVNIQIKICLSNSSSSFYFLVRLVVILLFDLLARDKGYMNHQ